MGSGAHDYIVGDKVFLLESDAQKYVDAYPHSRSDTAFYEERELVLPELEMPGGIEPPSFWDRYSSLADVGKPLKYEPFADVWDNEEDAVYDDTEET